MLKNKFFILAIITFISLNLNAQKQAFQANFIKQQLIKGITSFDKIYDITKNFELDQEKATLIFEAFNNTIDNPQSSLIELNKFKYHENKLLYQKIRNSEYYIVGGNVPLSDSNYDFEKQRFFLFPEGKFVYFMRHPEGRGNFNLVYDKQILINVPVNEAKALTEGDGNFLFFLCSKINWSTVENDNIIEKSMGGNSVNVLKVDIVRAIIVDTNRMKFYKSY